MALTDVKSEQIQSSVALAGSPTTTTQSASDNSTKIATTAYVETAVANLVASAPSALNTLDELAAALNDDASFSTTVTNSIATKLPLAGGTLTGALTINHADGLLVHDTNGTANNRLKFLYNGTSGVATLGPHSASGNTSLVIGTSNSGTFTTALTISSSQAATFAGTIATGGITINGAGSTISDSSDLGIVSGGDLTVDVTGDITLDADGADINFKDAGTLFGQISNASGLYLVSNISNAPMYLRGNDGGSYVNGLTIDFQNGGNVGIGTAPDSDVKLHVKGDGARVYVDSDDYNLVSLGRRGSSGADLDRAYLRMKSAGANTVVIDTAGISYFNGGTLAVGTTSTVGSSAEKFVVSGTGSAHSRFAGNSDSYSTLYIKNSSTTADTNQPFLTFQDTGGNRGNLGLRYSTAQLVIQGHGGVGIKGGSGFSGDPNIFVNTSGKVGIGTSSPDTFLDIEHTTNTHLQGIHLTNKQTGGYGSAIRFNSRRSDGGQSLEEGAQIRSEGANSWNSNGTTATNLIFSTRHNNTLAARMSIQSAGEVRVGAVARQSIAKLNVRENGAAIEFGHQNNGAGYFGTIGAFGSAGHPYIGFSCFSEASANTFTTLGHAGTIITGNLSGELRFMRVTQASNTGQTPIESMKLMPSNGLQITMGTQVGWKFRAYAYDSDSYFGVYDDNNHSANIKIDRSDGLTVFYVMGHTGNYHFYGSDTSDRDLKENIVSIPDGSLNLVKQLKPCTFNFHAEGYGKDTRTGFIAQEVAEVFTTDNHVATGTDGNKDMGVDHMGIIAHLTKAVQELSAEVELLKAKVGE